MRLGFHLSIAGSLLRAISQAQRLGCQALQIFVQNPRVWRWRQVDPAEVRDFIRARRRAGLGPLMVHLSYLPNLAATEPLLQQQTAARLAQELTLARALEADYLVVHPGHGELSEASFQRVARTLGAAVSQVPPPPLVLLENTAGQGRELGWRPDQLQRIMDLSGVDLGLCLDTAHAFAAGFDLR
ncbi:MAG: TIM barrel protein, partial [Desulfobaccales bacterium]